MQSFWFLEQPRPQGPALRYGGRSAILKIAKSMAPGMALFLEVFNHETECYAMEIVFVVIINQSINH